MRQSALSTEEWLSLAWGRAEAAPPSLLALWDLALTWRKTLLTNDKFLLRVQKPTSSSFCLLLETLGNVVNIRIKWAEKQHRFGCLGGVQTYLTPHQQCVENSSLVDLGRGPVSDCLTRPRL